MPYWLNGVDGTQNLHGCPASRATLPRRGLGSHSPSHKEYPFDDASVTKGLTEHGLPFRRCILREEGWSIKKVRSHSTQERRGSGYLQHCRQHLCLFTTFQSPAKTMAWHWLGFVRGLRSLDCDGATRALSTLCVPRQGRSHGAANTD